MATGLMGGTFDPIHIGHLIIAEEALDVLKLRQLVFVPAARPPHKHRAVTPIGARLEMVRRAIADNSRLALSDVEARRDEPSYTIETIRHFRSELGEQEEIHFVMGADSLAQFRTWKEPEELLSMCSFIVVPRPGFRTEECDDSVRESVRILDSPLLEISSTDIRERIRNGRPFRYLVPPAVRAYIEEKNLYS